MGLKNDSEQALKLHHDSILVDMHCDAYGALMPFELRTMTPMMRRLFPVERSLGERSDSGQVDLPRLIEGGTDCINFVTAGPGTLKLALQGIDVVYSEVEKNSDKIAIVKNYDEIMNNVAEGKISVLLSFEGADPIGGDLRILRMVYKLGIRLITLVWAYRNLLADSCSEQRELGGLSSVGVSFVEEMNRLGMLVDVSHINDAGFWDVLEVSKDPVVATHTCCRELSQHPRNLTDEMIKALAEKDGVMGVTFVKRFVSNDPEKANVTTVVDHIEHAVEIAGVDHVGIGSDFDGGGLALKDATEMPEITKELLRRGYSYVDIKKILGENFLRVFKEVWK